MQDQTIERWKTRFGKAAQLLSERLDDPPSLEELAAAAHISPYHFHRIWRVLTGETVSESVLRLRIEASKVMLASSGSNVTEIAMASGFGTPQSFARAFRRQTGTTPTLFRQESGGAAAAGEPMVEIVERGSTLVVALRHVGAFQTLNLTFGRVWSWAEQTGLLAGLQGIYGVPLDEQRYDVCLALGENLAPPPSPFKIMTLPGGPAARLRHFGSYLRLGESDDRLIEWLLTSGHEPADHPIYRHFQNDPDVTPEADLITDLWLPLQ